MDVFRQIISAIQMKMMKLIDLSNNLSGRGGAREKVMEKSNFLDYLYDALCKDGEESVPYEQLENMSQKFHDRNAYRINVSSFMSRLETEYTKTLLLERFNIVLH